MEMANHVVKRTFDLLNLYATHYAGKKIALGGKNTSGWYTYTAAEYIENTNNISLGLLNLGLKKGDKVATVTVNRPEWNFVDLGLAQAGMVHVPIYPTISISDYKYILQHCEAKYVFVGDQKLYEKIELLVTEIDTLEGIFSFEDIHGVRSWKQLADEGKESSMQHQLSEIKESITEDELATIIYTSGTTGLPKGVMLSHRNLVSNFTQHSQNHHLGQESIALSFLPLCHVYERSMNYHFQFKGMSIYYVGNLAQILPALKEVKPDMFNTVPRLLERIYDGLINKGKELKGIKKTIFFWAVSLGDKFDYGKKFSWFYHQKRKIADKLIYTKWREALGGNIKIIVSGGAALQPRIGKVLGVAHIMTLEGYGLTETSPVIAVSNPVKNEIRIGTVGPVLPGVDLKIADDGEITCKGPNVMMGYYKDSERTKQVIDGEGYFHTGDIGVLIEDKYLKITDRKKEIFKLSGGKYIAPQMIENKLKESFFIEQAMVVGENEKFASAIIVPAFSYIKDWLKQKGLQYNKSKSELIQLSEVKAAIRKDVNEINKTLGEFEAVKRYRLINEEWSPETGEMSPTLKLKRNVLTERYNTLIDEIYSSQKQEPKETIRRVRIPRINLSLAELINKLRNNNLLFW
ncbi:MAG: long-chain fatty acid--CoA ligase [Prolixibacteraceae bacterium]|nr:long-chain fatty acid--CoA ligase [Prolixibacteraceae bacterium]MBN2648756.1 long-chain fatty acid--CoA ligase [Prolixibacteraceae bacterium]